MSNDTFEILRFDGIGAGLGKRSQSGDRNDPVSYTLFCAHCKVELGPLARFQPNKEGVRSAGCPFCNGATLVQHCSVVGTLTPEQVKAIVDKKNQAAVERSNKIVAP